MIGISCWKDVGICFGKRRKKRIPLAKWSENRCRQSMKSLPCVFQWNESRVFRQFLSVEKVRKTRRRHSIIPGIGVIPPPLPPVKSSFRCKHPTFHDETTVETRTRIEAALLIRPNVLDYTRYPLFGFKCGGFPPYVARASTWINPHNENRSRTKRGLVSSMGESIKPLVIFRRKVSAFARSRES